jgi:hypothetical protein
MSDTYSIKENSFWAKLAAKRMKSDKMAMVLGRTIHLHNTHHQEFLQNKRWLRHELMHIRQFRHYGWIRFLFLYLVESIRKGYYLNRFELEAREAEQDPFLEEQYSFRPGSGQEKLLT